MKFIKQALKVKKGEISENIFSYLDFTQHQTLIPKILGKKKDTLSYFYDIVSITLTEIFKFLLVYISFGRELYINRLAL